MAAAVAESLPEKPIPDRTVILFPAAVHLGALTAFLPGIFSWPAVGVAVFLHCLIEGLGITLGYHRRIAHRSFLTPKR